MILRRAALVWPFVATLTLLAAEPALEFSGVMTAEGKTRVALTDKSTNVTTWVEPGSTFKGYSVVRYDPKEEAVFVKQGGRETRLALIAAKTSAPGPTTAPPAKTETAANASAQAVRANLRHLANVARQYMQERGTSSASFTDIVGPGKPIQELVPIAGENYSTLSFGANVTGVSVTTADGAVVSLDIPPASGTATTSAPSSTSTTTVIAQSPAPAPASTPNPVTAAAGGVAPAGLPAPSSMETLPPTGRQPASPSYIIQGGDTWQTVSQKTGVPVQQLRQLNTAILDGSSLPAGQPIRIR